MIYGVEGGFVTLSCAGSLAGPAKVMVCCGPSFLETGHGSNPSVVRQGGWPGGTPNHGPGA